MANRWVKAVQREVVAPPEEPLRVMPLGDSITDDYTRYQTWEGLVEAGYTVDFVGTQTSVPSSRGGDVPDVAGQVFDQDHEGHSAWAASDMLAGKDSEPDAGRLELWLEETPPADVVLLHIGTNDIGRLLTDPRLVVDRTSRIVFQIQQAMPDATILVAQVTPLGSEK
jgi:lysophospholipase L1-like esterase